LWCATTTTMSRYAWVAKRSIAEGVGLGCAMPAVLL
jgi:hypothetical protein